MEIHRNSACSAVLLLLDAPECSKPFWFIGGDHGSVVLLLEIVVAVGEVDRRVHCVHVAEEVGLRICVWDWVSHSARTHSSERMGLGRFGNSLP